MRRALQALYFGLEVLFALCVAFQVYLAGAGIFAGSGWFTWHMALGSSLMFFALLTLIPGLVAGFPHTIKWLSALQFVLVVAQPVLIWGGSKSSVPLLSALHPVNALVIFVLSLYLCIRAWRTLRAA